MGWGNWEGERGEGQNKTDTLVFDIALFDSLKKIKTFT